jgi:excisionase family DNA binding protein
VPVAVGGQKLYSTQECALMLGVRTRRVQQFIKEGRLSAQKIGRLWFVREKDLQKFAAKPRPTGNLTGLPRTPKHA